MKTIFIAIFEGIEAKNILRTPVLQTLLSDPEARLVLFTKSEERVDFYQKEFKNPRIFYEVVKRPAPSGLDRFFVRLKFQLLRTASTGLRRQMAYESHKNPLIYYGGYVLNWLIARSVFRRFARFLDYHLVKTDIYGNYFEKYRPDLVFLSHLFDEPEIHFLREARRHGVKTVGFINSWDKVTARCALRLLPDKAIVFNDIVKKEVIHYNEMLRKDIFVSGQPQYDFYFTPEHLGREEFFGEIKADPAKKLLVYAPIGSAFGGSDWEILDLLLKLNEEEKFSEKLSILVRFQPNDFFPEEEIKKRPGLLYDYPGVRFSSERGVDWDMNFDDLKHLKSTLANLDVLVSYATSLGIDAAIFDKPVININFEITKMPLSRSALRFYRTDHYKKALVAGGIRLASSEAELIEWVNKYLTEPGLNRAGRKELILSQCQFIDGKSGERIGKFILNYAQA